MKNLYLFILPILLLSCNKYETVAEIDLEYEGDEQVIVRTPIDDIFLWDNHKDTLKTEDGNQYTFEKEIDKPELAILRIGDHIINSILIPSEKINLYIDDSTFKFIGKNQKGLELLNKIKDPIYTVKEANKFRQDSTASQIKIKIDSLKKQEIKELNVLRENDHVDKILLEILQNEINYFYALRTLQVVINKQNQTFPINKDLIELFDQTVNNYPLNIKYKPSSWLEYANEIVLSKELYDRRVRGELTIDTIKKLYENDKFFEYQFNIISKYEDPKIAEKVTAYILINSAKQDNYEKSLIYVFENFQKEYPNSKYTTYLKSAIDPIVAYHQKIDRKMPDGVEFINGENLNNFKELTAALKGEKYYVDIWATWCGPCKIEFQYNQKLDSILKKKGYKKLYISVDEPDQEEKWRDDIKYYELMGLNIRASKNLHLDLINKYGVNSIPRYFILDREGNLKNEHAPRPSNFERLQKVL